MIAFNIVIIAGLVAWVCRICWLAGVVEGIRRANRVTQATWEETHNTRWRDEQTREACRGCLQDVAACCCPMVQRRGRA